MGQVNKFSMMVSGSGFGLAVSDTMLAITGLMILGNKLELLQN